MSNNNSILFIEDINKGKDFSDSEANIIYEGLLMLKIWQLKEGLCESVKDTNKLLEKMENNLYSASLAYLKEGV